MRSQILYQAAPQQVQRANPILSRIGCYLDVPMHQMCVHAMRPTGGSVSVPGILKVVVACLERLLEHHVVIGCVATMDGQIHLVVKYSAAQQRMKNYCTGHVQ